jgi:hypothetical protein
MRPGLCRSAAQLCRAEDGPRWQQQTLNQPRLTRASPSADRAVSGGFQRSRGIADRRRASGRPAQPRRIWLTRAKNTEHAFEAQITAGGFSSQCIQPLCHPSTRNRKASRWHAEQREAGVRRLGRFDIARSAFPATPRSRWRPPRPRAPKRRPARPCSDVVGSAAPSPPARTHSRGRAVR